MAVSWEFTQSGRLVGVHPEWPSRGSSPRVAVSWEFTQGGRLVGVLVTLNFQPRVAVSWEFLVSCHFALQRVFSFIFIHILILSSVVPIPIWSLLNSTPLRISFSNKIHFLTARFMTTSKSSTHTKYLKESLELQRP